MKKKVLLSLATFALATASAATHKVTLFQTSLLNGTELKPGSYKLTVDGDKAVLSSGKQKYEAAVKTEAAASKFSSTSVRYQNGDGKYRIQEIRLGGTNTKIVFAN